MVAELIKKWIMAVGFVLIPASAYAVGADQQALMVIRFNQAHVAYEKPLYTTLSRALEVYPQAHFTVVSVAPAVQDKEEQKRQDALSQSNLEKVQSTIKAMGMPAERLAVQKTHEGVDSSEVRIYVE